MKLKLKVSSFPLASMISPVLLILPQSCIHNTHNYKRLVNSVLIPGCVHNRQLCVQGLDNDLIYVYSRDCIDNNR